MAFCRFCGKELAEGEVCSCQQAAAQAAPQAAPQAEPQAAPKSIPMDQVTAQVTAVAGDVSKNALDILKTPVSGVASFIKSGNLVMSIVLIALHAICAGFVMLAGTYEPTAKTYFLPVLETMLYSLGLAGVYFGMCKLFDHAADFKQALASAAVRSIYMVPVAVIAIILCFIKKYMGYSFYATLNQMMTMAMFLLAIKDIKTEGEQNTTKLFYLALGGYFIVDAVLYFVF